MKKTVVLSFPTSCFIQVKHPIYIRKEETMEVSQQEKRCMKEGNVVQQRGLYRSEFEHDNCGIGAVVNIKGVKTHQTVEQALHIVENLEHRAGKDGSFHFPAPAARSPPALRRQSPEAEEALPCCRC